MISFPSSFQSSRISNKENYNPNSNPHKPTRIIPFSHQKLGCIKPEDFPSAISAVQDNKKQRLRTHSMKTLVNGFSNPISQTTENQNIQSFLTLISRAAGHKNQLNKRQLIQFCQQNSIKNKQDLFTRAESREKYDGPKNSKQLKRILGTDLGHLKIQQLCECLQKGDNITKQQQQIIQLLIPYDIDEQINTDIIIQQYEHLKEQLKAENQDKKQLSIQFKNIYRTKIQPKLWSDHFRLELNKSLNLRAQKQKISFSSLCKSLQAVLNQHQCSIVFRHIYSLETSTIMPILDRNKKINKQILLANLTQHGQNQIDELCFQEKNVNYILQENYKTITKLKQTNKKQLQMLINKDQQIQRLNRLIDLLKIENESTQKFNKTKMETQMQAYKNKYETKIQNLISKNEEQAKLTEWYQRELQAIMKQVDKQNIIHRYLLSNQ